MPANRNPEGTVSYRMNRVPVKLQRDFKLLCIQRGTSMRDALIEHMAEQVERYGWHDRQEVTK